MNYADIREQKRADKAAEAEQKRLDEQARRDQERQDQREREEKREQRKEQARQRRAERVSAATTFLRNNPVNVLMSAIIVVPALLAWSAMATYGAHIYGVVGVLLPLFTECAMWAFSFAAHSAKRRERPTWMLNVGVWAFTAAAGVINYTHGAEMGGPLQGGVMAAVSVGGVIAHQIYMAADRDRRTRADRQRSKQERLVAKRTHQMSVAAVRQAAGQVHPDGSVELLVRPGAVTLSRSRLRPWQPQVTYGAAVPGAGADAPSEPSSGVAEQIEAWLASNPDDDRNTPVPADENALRDPSDDLRSERVGNAVPDSAETPARGRSWDELVHAFWHAVRNGEVTPTSQRNVRNVLRCSRDRAKDLVALYQDNADGPEGGALAAQ